MQNKNIFDPALIEDEYIIEGDAFSQCMKRIGITDSSISDYTFQKYRASAGLDLYMFQYHCNDADPEAPETSMFDRVYVIAMLDTRIVGVMDGYWISLKNLLLYDDFRQYLEREKKELGEAVAFIHGKLFPSVPQDKTHLEFMNEYALGVINNLEVANNISLDEEYLYIGRSVEIDPELNQNGIYKCMREVMMFWIRMENECSYINKDIAAEAVDEGLQYDSDKDLYWRISENIADANGE